MDLSKVKPSKNVIDRTGWGEREEGLNRIGLALNPVIAARKVRDDLLAKGIIEPPKRTINLGMPKRGGM